MPPRHIPRPTSLRALHRVPSGVVVCTGFLNLVQPPQVAPASRLKLAPNPRSVSEGRSSPGRFGSCPANTRKCLQETRGEALPRCGPCVARVVIVRESRVTGVQETEPEDTSWVRRSIRPTRRANGSAHLPAGLSELRIWESQHAPPVSCSDWFVVWHSLRQQFAERVGKRLARSMTVQLEKPPRQPLRNL